MINIQIPKDIREYETKFIGPFTMKQSIAIVCAAIVEFAGVKLIQFITGGAVMAYLPALIFAIIPLVVGFGEKIFGVPFEVWFRYKFLNKLVYKPKRTYLTHNYLDVQMNRYEQELRQEQLNQESKKTSTKKQKKDKPEIDIPEELRAYK